ncbi:hypothetical protein LTS17_005587 [Exophiala oligosperma]
MAPSKVQLRPAKLLSSRAYRVPGQLLITEYFFNVPLDHADPDGEQIRLFCRGGERWQSAVVPPKEKEYLPWFVYITGGPGFPGRPPQDQPGLTNEVLDRGYKFLSFDHRGMGLSTPVTADTLKLKGDSKAQARYLKFFRADNAVRDLEAIRKCLTDGYPDDDRKRWTIMGQSYGGYVCFTYLSFYPEGLREAFPLGGTPPVTAHSPDEPVRRLFRKVRERNDAFFAKFPEDKVNVKNVARHIAQTKPMLPSGVALTPARFLELGIYLGFHGGFDMIHAAVLRAVNDLELFGFLTRPTLTQFENWPSFDNHPIYALLHGALYAQGQAPDWAFDRVRGEEEFGSMFKYSENTQNQQVYLTGEMVFRSVFSDNADLRRVAETAELLESDSDWPALYDLDRLRRNTVPVYAAVFADDMYVDLNFSLKTAGLVDNYHMHLTNVMFHDAIRAKTADVLKAVFSLRDDTLL